MADQTPAQPPPPYPGDAEKAYPPGSAPYPPQQGAPYPPQQGAPYPPQPAGQPGYPQAGYAPQPASYQQPPTYPQQPATVATVVVNAPQIYRDLPSRTKCPNCENEVTTQGGYPTGPGIPPQGAQQTVVVSQPAHTVTTVVQHFGDMPVNTKCPNCHNQVTTQVSHEPGTMAWLACFLMFLFGFWLCCCIPFCVDGMQNANHHCPVCKYRIATYNR